MQSYWPKSRDICIAVFPCISTPKTFRLMGKANFLPGNRRKENKTSNSLHQHFLLASSPQILQHLWNISMWKLKLRKSPYASCCSTRQQRDTKCLSSKACLSSRNKNQENIPVSLRRLPHKHEYVFLTYHESHFTGRETVVITSFGNYVIEDM